MNGLMSNTMYRSILIVLVYTCAISVRQTIAQNEAKEQPRSSDECQVTPVIHVLQYPGCVPKPIPSFACIGRCSSYLQVEIWKIYKYFVEKNKWKEKTRWKLFLFCVDSNRYQFQYFSLRFREVKFGKWSDHVCVARNLVNEKRRFHCFAQKLNQANENSAK